MRLQSVCLTSGPQLICMYPLCITRSSEVCLIAYLKSRLKKRKKVWLQSEVVIATLSPFFVFFKAFHFILSLSEGKKLPPVCVCDGWGLVVLRESDGLGKMTGWHRGQARWRLNMLGSGERCQSCRQPSRNTQEHLGKGDSKKKQTEAPL